MTNMNNVYIVQRPARYCREKRDWVNKYDISAAEEYGKFIYMLGPGNIFKDKFQNSIDKLDDHLKDFTTNDYLLAIGDPIAIAISSILAAKYSNESVNILKFDRLKNIYISYKILTNSNNGKNL